MVDRSIRLRSVHWKIASMVLNQSRKLCQLNVKVDGSLPLFSVIWKVGEYWLRRVCLENILARNGHASSILVPSVLHSGKTSGKVKD